MPSEPLAWLRLRTVVDGAPVALTVVPRSVNWKRNTVRKADTLKAVVRFMDLPVDPRALQGANVALHFVDNGHPDTRFDDKGSRAFIGVVDTWEVTLDGSTMFVNLTARDNTAFFLDAKVQQEKGKDGKVGPKRYNIDRPLYQVIMEIIADLSDGDIAGGPVAGIAESFRKYALTRPHLQTNLFRVRGVPKKRGGNFLGTENNEDLWTVMSKLCELQGTYPHFYEGELRVEKVDASEVTRYRFQYGGHASNLTKLKMKRDFRGISKQPVVLRCYNKDATDPQKRVVEGRWPPRKAAPRQLARKQSTATPAPTPQALTSDRTPGLFTYGRGLQTPETVEAAEDLLSGNFLDYAGRQEAAIQALGPLAAEHVENKETVPAAGTGQPSKRRVEDRVLYISGAYTEKQLNEIARAVYMRRAAEALTGKFDTAALRDGNNRRVWSIRNGDLLDVAVDTSGPAFPWDRNVGTMARRFENLGMFPVEARSLAESIYKVSHANRFNDGYVPVLYVLSASHTFTAGKGYSVSVDFASVLGDFK